MKKYIFLLILPLFLCIFKTAPVFKTLNFSQVSVEKYGKNGCEVTLTNEQGLKKKFSTNNVSSNIKPLYFDFNGDGVKDVFVCDMQNFEVINFAGDIPLAFISKNIRTPPASSVKREENKINVELKNGKSFILSLDKFNIRRDFVPVIDKSFIVFPIDFDSDGIYELCFEQKIKGPYNKDLFILKSYAKFINDEFHFVKIIAYSASSLG